MSNTQLSLVEEQAKNFSAQAGEEIGYEKGAKMVKNYFDKNETVSEGFIGRNTIEAILAQPGAVGMAVLQGLDKDGQQKPVLVAVNANGDYILNVTSVGANGELAKQKGIVASGVISPGGLGVPQGW